VVSTKEKKEIGLILGSVLLVAIVGMITANAIISSVGQATHLTLTTYSGMITLLNEYCEPIESNGDCQQTCLVNKMDVGAPLVPDGDICHCCKVPVKEKLVSTN